MLVVILLLLSVLAFVLVMFGVEEGEPGAILLAIGLGTILFMGFGEHHDLKMQADNAETYQAYYEKAMDANKSLTGKLKAQKSLTSEYQSQVETLGTQVDTLQDSVLEANQRTQEAKDDLQEVKAKLERVQELTGSLAL